jgi:hypothetical protein
VAVGSLLDGEAAPAVAYAGAAQLTGLAAVILGLSAVLTGSPRYLVRHPAPVLIILTTVPAWLGAA